MKKRIILSTLFALLSTAALRADQTVSLSDFTDESFLSFIQGELEDVILECPAGTVLPFKVTVKGDFLEFTNEGSASVTVTKTIYAKCQDADEILFSADKATWKNFSDFFTGRIEGIVGVFNEIPTASLNLELNQR